jgi:hypothetical protein
MIIADWTVAPMLKGPGPSRAKRARPRRWNGSYSFPWRGAVLAAELVETATVHAHVKKIGLQQK